MYLKLVVTLCLITGGISAPSAKVSSSLQAIRKGGKANIFISFKDGTSTVLKNLGNRSYATREDQLNDVSYNLRINANLSQANVISYLHHQNIEDFKSYWITNQIFVKEADADHIKALASFSEVSEITPEEIIQLKPSKVTPTNTDLGYEVTWGIKKIQADEVWGMVGGNRGERIIVGGIDSGVRHTHEALAQNYVGEYGWYDPYQYSEIPSDISGHGTHTMGTAVGGKGIGVAPGAKWMACRGCDENSCSMSHLISCGEFMLCPTLVDGSHRDCSKAPHIVNNAWGGPPGEKIFHRVVDSWIAAGIVPIFSNGNSGPNCYSASSPGDHPLVIAVGNTDVDDSLYIGSSRGPAKFGEIKPDLSAPGTDIYSAKHTDDTAYGLQTGTSMACPHVSGVAALLLSHNGNLTLSEVKDYLLYGNEQSGLKKTKNECGDVPDNIFPNNHFGNGRINALKSVTKLVEDTSL